MPKEAPFDVWDGEDLETVEVTEVLEVEEMALHVDPESLLDPEPGPRWSDLTDNNDEDEADDVPVSYFEDEQPEAERIVLVERGEDEDDDDSEPDLEELLERQHYSFPATADD